MTLEQVCDISRTSGCEVLHSTIFKHCFAESLHNSCIASGLNKAAEKVVLSFKDFYARDIMTAYLHFYPAKRKEF